MSDLTPKTRDEMLLSGENLEPKNRKEMFLKRIYDKTQTVPEPETREEYFLKKAGDASGDITIEQLNVTESGTYAEQGKAYSPVVVNVPSYLVKDVPNLPQAVASFDDGEEYPIMKLKFDITATQSGSGDPSPINICPISGWDGANVEVVGANLWGGYTMAQDINSKSSTSTIDTTNKTVTYDKASGSPDIFTMPFKENTRYTLILSASNSSSNTSLLLSYTNGTTDTVTVNTSGSKQVIVVTSASNKTLRSVKLSYYQTALTTVYYNESGLFEGVLTADDFVPYNNDSATYPISWQTKAGTIYGGNFKLFKDGGKWYCTVTAEKSLLTDSDMRSGVTVSSSTDSVVVYQMTISDAKNDSWIIANRFSTQIPTGNAGQMVKGGRILYWVIAKSELSSYDASGCYDWFDTHPSQFLYNLATPETYTFEISTEIATLLGVNNIFADCGDVEECRYVTGTL